MLLLVPTFLLFIKLGKSIWKFNIDVDVVVAIVVKVVISILTWWYCNCCCLLVVNPNNNFTTKHGRIWEWIYANRIYANRLYANRIYSIYANMRSIQSIRSIQIESSQFIRIEYMRIRVLFDLFEYIRFEYGLNSHICEFMRIYSIYSIYSIYLNIYS